LHARELLLLGSGDATGPLADLARADIAAATAAVAAAAEDDGDTETGERPLTPIDVRRIAQAHSANGGERTWHMPRDERDARPRCAANALNQSVCAAASKRQ
jgi:hypothetical protein